MDVIVEEIKMANRKVLQSFIKLSGDLLNHSDVLNWIKSMGESGKTVVCIGGGTLINQAFKEKKLDIKFGPLGRITDEEGAKIALKILQDNQIKIQDLFVQKNIQVKVIIPVIEVGDNICHVNGDIYALAAYNGFDNLYVATLKDRVADKEKYFAPYPKIKIVGF